MGKRKRAAIEKTPEPVEQPLPPSVRRSDAEPPVKKGKWVNKQRALIFASRGISYRDRHLMQDLRNMMPHAKADTKMDKKDNLMVINEITEIKNCNKCIYFEAKKKQDLYMWLSNTPKGPSAKFLVENVHTMSETKMTGNCLKGTRPLLSFDPQFDKDPQWALLKEMFIQTFGTPNHHPKSQPFFDHIFTFAIADNRIWFRNYQIIEENGELVEIGPRFVMNPIRIFAGSFGGVTLYSNPNFVSPNQVRREAKAAKGMKYIKKAAAKKSYEERRPEYTYKLDETDEVFNIQN